MATQPAELADRLRLFCNHGSTERNLHQRVGFNSRLDAIQAAILRIKLRHVEATNKARREPLRQKLDEAGIATAVHYAMPAYRQPALAKDYREVALPVAERVARQCLSLPMYPELGREQVETIVEAIRRGFD